jgi:hypothetical protein
VLSHWISLSTLFLLLFKGGASAQLLRRMHNQTLGQRLLAEASIFVRFEHVTAGKQLYLEIAWQYFEDASFVQVHSPSALACNAAIH